MAGTNHARMLRTVDEDGRPTVRITGDPDAIRTLTRTLDDRGIPDTYVRDGELIVVEPVSGTAPATGEDDAPLPLAAVAASPKLNIAFESGSARSTGEPLCGDDQRPLRRAGCEALDREPQAQGQRVAEVRHLEAVRPGDAQFVGDLGGR